tara:strand:+ start:6057 stop:6581 length:525 start_codon:yes stop_codon:yes gene_type:complete
MVNQNLINRIKSISERDNDFKSNCSSAFIITPLVVLFNIVFLLCFSVVMYFFFTGNHAIYGSVFIFAVILSFFSFFISTLTNIIGIREDFNKHFLIPILGFISNKKLLFPENSVKEKYKEFCDKQRKDRQYALALINSEKLGINNEMKQFLNKDEFEIYKKLVSDHLKLYQQKL